MADFFEELTDDEQAAALMGEEEDGEVESGPRLGRSVWASNLTELDWRDFNTQPHDPASAQACRAQLFSDDPLIRTFGTMIDELRRTYADTDGHLDAALQEIYSTLQVFIAELILRPGETMVRLLRRHHPEVAAEAAASLRKALDEFEERGWR